jgi:hydroxymethylpyrimidine pyrophosphatase-like HAD family hydrolase
MKKKFIAVDFDGTCVKHRYPFVGEDIGAAPILKKLIENGHRIILLTMRGSGTVLRDALTWFSKNEIPLYAINQNPSQTWSDSRKVFADYYIDNQAVGCPMIDDNGDCYVDWDRVDEWFKDQGLYD